MREHEPMTYFEIREWVDMHAALNDLDLESLPWAISRWLRWEVLPVLRKAGRYEWPAALDAVCPSTVPVNLGRYIYEHPAA